MLHRGKILFLALLAIGCQSTRISTILPATETYRSDIAIRTSVPVTPTPPILIAALPTEIAREETKNIYLRPASTSLSLVPDTTDRASKTAISGKADPTTTVVNSIGGAIAAVGIGVVIANSGEAPKTEWGGLGQLILFLGGLIMALLGLGLLFFQGKNGRLRRLREARKAAALPSAQTSGQTIVPESINPDARVGQKPKTGFCLMIIGGIMGLLGFLISGYFLLLLPVAVIVLLVGAVLSIVQS
ncbi:hypothetical protein [Hymenobacter norwichensis]|uniref:hypothetical protein n=1 Tax=Hymenobacter norwichensis TaxID=223903 RepID=UPI0012FAF36D|nr:hypothetical protein [Hymenobacter norwichensis]